MRRLQQASVLSAISEPAPVNVPIPYETTAPSLAWVKEGSPKGVTLLALASVKLGLHKFSGISVHSRELAALTEGRAVDAITNRLVNASRRFLDRQLLDPAVAAVASTNPASLTNGVTPVAAGATLDDTIAALTAAFWTAYPDAIRPTFVMSPATASKVNAKDTHRDLRVGGGVLNGIPAVTTLGALTNVILLDASAIFAYDGGAEVDQSRHAAIQMEAAPTDPPTAATTVLDLWSHNLIGLRLDRWCSWAKVPNSVQYAGGCMTRRDLEAIVGGIAKPIKEQLALRDTQIAALTARVNALEATQRRHEKSVESLLDGPTRHLENVQ